MATEDPLVLGGQIEEMAPDGRVCARLENDHRSGGAILLVRQAAAFTRTTPLDNQIQIPTP